MTRRNEEAGTSVQAQPLGCAKLTKDIVIKAKSAYPVLYIPEEDEIYIKEACFQACQELKYDCWVWEAVTGLTMLDIATGERTRLDKSENPKVAFLHLDNRMTMERREPDSKKRRKVLVILQDFGHQMLDAVNRRWIRNLMQALKSTPSMIVLTGPGVPIPPELTKEILVVHLPMPDAQATEHILMRNIREKDKQAMTPDRLLGLVEASAGLSYHEKECAFAEASSLNELNAKSIWKSKAKMISSPELKFVDTDTTMDSIGGFEIAKAWLKSRVGAYLMAGKNYGLPSPLGCVFLGPPGTGKSAICEAIGSMFDMPTFMMDIRSCLRPHVGDSERVFREVMYRCEEIRRAVIIFDDFEKMFHGASTQGESDSGLFIAMFGNFLTWAARRREKGLELFFAANCNAVKDLSSALTRAGRFDVIWYVDLPNRTEREAIIRIHSAKHKSLSLASDDHAKLAALCQGYSGAEIEQSIINALFRAFNDGQRKATADDVLFCIKQLKPCSELYEEELKEMERWRRRTVPASLPDKPDVVDSGRVVTSISTKEEGLN